MFLCEQIKVSRRKLRSGIKIFRKEDLNSRANIILYFDKYFVSNINIKIFRKKSLKAKHEKKLNIKLNNLKKKEALRRLKSKNGAINQGMEKDIKIGKNRSAVTITDEIMPIKFAEATEEISSAFVGTNDMIRLDFNIGSLAAAMFYIDGLIDKELLDEHILRPLKRIEHFARPYADSLNKFTMMTTPLRLEVDIEEGIKIVAGGDIVLLIEGGESLYVYSEKKYPTRAIQEPPVANVLRGPREGFVEDLKTNITMLRRRFATPDLKMEILQVGKYTNTRVCIAYLGTVADDSIVNEVRKKIAAIEIDGIVESSYIARYLENKKLSIFSQVGASEKPDTVTGKMLEGRVAIFVDGSPMVLTVPFVLFESYQTSEDYYLKSYRSSLIRMVRLMAMFIAIMLPATYVALQQFQYQMLPFKILVSIIDSVSTIPLSPAIEMMLMLVMFEILSETSIRMPRYIGMALSIMGAIVLGETAVSAGIVSSPTILVTALSTIGLYCVPDETNAASLLRLLFVAIGGVLGIFGIVAAGVFLIAYLCTIESFGVAYCSPLAPMLTHDWQDGVFKDITGEMVERPYTIPTKNRTRIKNTSVENLDDEQKGGQE